MSQLYKQDFIRHVGLKFESSLLYWSDFLTVDLPGCSFWV